MATDIVTKGMLETRLAPRNLSALISGGAALSSVLILASRTDPYPQQQTTLNAPIAIADATVSLNADPGKGAKLFVDTGANQEILKVKSVTGASPWVCAISPVAWATHTSGIAVNYEPGMNARILVNDTPAINTPSTGSVMPSYRKGCHGQNYSISFLAVLNNAEEIEDEVLLSVVDPASSGTNIKQPYETRDISADFTKLLEEPHQNPGTTTLSSAIAYISSNLSSFTTTLAVQATAGSTVITLVSTNPGVGAMLILTPAGTGSNPPERVYVVSVVANGGNWDVTLAIDLEFTHSIGASVTVFRGYSAAFLVSSTSSILGLSAVNRARRGQAGVALKAVWLATTSQAEVLQRTAIIDVEDIS